MPVIQDSKEIIEALNNHEVFIVSAAMEFKHFIV